MLNSKREPQRDEFDSDEAYRLAFVAWKETRESNNQSVKRSRENAKLRKAQHEELCRAREKENLELENQLGALQEEVNLLGRVLQAPQSLSLPEIARLKAVLEAADPWWVGWLSGVGWLATSAVLTSPSSPFAEPPVWPSLFVPPHTAALPHHLRPHNTPPPRPPAPFPFAYDASHQPKTFYG